MARTIRRCPHCEKAGVAVWRRHHRPDMRRAELHEELRREARAARREIAVEVEDLAADAREPHPG